MFGPKGPFRQKVLRLLAFAAAASPLFAAGGTVRLLQKPAMNKTSIVFSYAGDLWTVSRQGGVAARLTGGTGIETFTAFSPDGATVAFTGQYDGNTDVYTIPAAGGVPRRITYHPEADHAIGWTPDGKRILFRSIRESYSRFTQLFTVPAEGGPAEVLPLPMASAGSYSPDGKRLAYAPLDSGQYPTGFGNFVSWKRYRGGRASYLWIANLADLSTVKIPRTDSNDMCPMWIGDKVYFLSDRNGPMTLFRYDPQSRQVTELVRNTGKEIVHASAGPGGIVYEQFGQIYVYDIGTQKSSPVPIEIQSDLSEVRPRFQNVARELSGARISPSGARALFEAHGEILSVPAEKGDIRNLSNTPGAMDRLPAWSPDGRSIAWFSDESGEYALHIKPQSGEGEPRKIALAGKSAYYYDPQWSPDSKHVAFNDNQMNLWTVDVDAGKLTKIDTDHVYGLNRDFAWSPDSQWIAFVKSLPSRLHMISIYSLESGATRRITDGMSDAQNPAFDRDGQYLYFTASTNFGPTLSGLDMTSDEHEVTSSVYAVVLPNNVPSPVGPESDEEKPVEPRGNRGAANSSAADSPKPVRIDFDGLEQRIVALPIPARAYRSMAAGRVGVIYLTESDSSGRGAGPGLTLSKFDLKTRKLDKLADRVGSFDLSANGEKMLLRIVEATVRGSVPAPPPATPPIPQYVIVPANAAVRTGEGALRLANAEVLVDPLAEWKQMYREVWRIQRSFFYDPGLHGVNVADAEKEFEKYLDSLGSRFDLTYILQTMLGEMTVGHLRGAGGTLPTAKTVAGGLLGADYEIANGRYRIRRIYTGESWNPQLQAPLSGPGLNVKVGDYILSVNGRELSGTDDISRLLENTAGKNVILRFGPDPSGAGSRDISVRPVASEQQLRHQAWVEGNRRKVDQLSGGRLAYVYMPDTGLGGLTAFTRYYFAQTDRQGAVIDERFNSGGQVADYVIEVMNRPLQGWWSPRYGAMYRTPAAAVFGPKVMIINEFAGSGGDMMPWMFRHNKTGTLVGKRTWGGLVGISGYPTLMDGGTVTAPNFRFINPAGQWDVENLGTPPDVEVDQDPKLVKEGHDPQLERAVEIALQQMKDKPVPQLTRPDYPNFQRPAAPAGSSTSGGNNNR